MYKTFTFIIILCTALFFSPKQAAAFSAVELSSVDSKFGDKDMVKFYPNPMTTNAVLKISEEVDLERSKVVVIFYNIVGSEVHKISNVRDYEQKIDREIFKSTGIYFFQLKVDETILSTGRITVK